MADLSGKFRLGSIPKTAINAFLANLSRESHLRQLLDHLHLYHRLQPPYYLTFPAVSDQELKSTQHLIAVALELPAQVSNILSYRSGLWAYYNRLVAISQEGKFAHNSASLVARNL